MNKTYSLCGKEKMTNGHKFSAIYIFKGLDKIQVEKVEAGDISALLFIIIHIYSLIKVLNEAVPNFINET